MIDYVLSYLGLYGFMPVVSFIPSKWQRIIVSEPAMSS